MPTQYKVNSKLTTEQLTYYREEVSLSFTVNDIIAAIAACNADLTRQYTDADKYPAPIIKNIPLKNTSGAVGECFGQHLAIQTKAFQKNPHEAGAPDFLPVVPSAEPWMSSPTKKYYPYGGFDTKASYTNKNKFMSVNASSHHDETTTVFVVQWTKTVDKIPQIIGTYYANNLIPSDWSITQSKPGTKTTNGGSLNATGRQKLRDGWIVLHDSVQLPSNKLKAQYGL